MTLKALPPGTDVISLADIEAAARRIAPHAVMTPLARADDLDQRTGGRIFLKAEPLQRTGSFKFRGAFNRMAQIPEGERGAGVVACSSGNHAQGVAAAARLLGMRAVIVMPRDAPAVKIANTRALGGEVVLYDRLREDRDGLSRALADERGATLVHPFDDPGVMAGQGTVGLEMIAQARAHDVTFDDVLVCCSGGGLSGGVATAFAALSPSTRVWSVEPETHDDMRRSLMSGTREANDSPPVSICDALLAASPGRITFPVNHALLAGGLAVSDTQVLAAMAYALKTLKLVVEPGGAVALAAVLSGKIETAGRQVGVVLSGGNTDPVMLVRALEAPQ